MITGGGSGIGRGIALYFCERGYNVAIIGRDVEKLKMTCDEAGPMCTYFQADVTSRDQVFTAINAIAGQYGHIDVLINNAGSVSNILTTTPIEEAEARFREMFDVHVMGAFLAVMAAVPHLTRPGGRVINISSIAAFHGGAKPGGCAYAGAKAALNAMTMSWARELGPEGITANGIAPGFIDTALTKLWSEDRRKLSLSNILVGRAGEPEDIAATAYFLASPEAGFITGEIINANGGALFVT